MRTAKWLSVFAGLLVPLSACAQWNASAYIGKTHTANADLHVEQPSGTATKVNDIGFDDRSFRPPLYYGLRGGYLFNPALGLEAELIHVKAFARLPPAIPIQQYNVSHGLNLLLGNLVLQRQIARRMNLSFRAGLGFAIPHPEIRAFDQTLERYELHGLAVQFAAGANFRLTRHVFLLGEYKFTATKPRFEIGSAAIGNTFATHHIVSGVGFQF
jgi:lipid A oxidase